MNLGLAAELGLDRMDREEIALDATIAASFANRLVDKNLAQRLGQGCLAREWLYQDRVDPRWLARPHQPPAPKARARAAPAIHTFRRVQVMRAAARSLSDQSR